MFPPVKKGSAFPKASRKWKGPTEEGEVKRRPSGAGAGCRASPAKRGRPALPRALALPASPRAAHSRRTLVAHLSLSRRTGASGAAGAERWARCRLPVSAPWRPRGMSGQRGDRPQAPPAPRGPWLRPGLPLRADCRKAPQETRAGGRGTGRFHFRFSRRAAPRPGGGAGPAPGASGSSVPRPPRARVPRSAHGDRAPRRPPRPPRGRGR